MPESAHTPTPLVLFVEQCDSSFADRVRGVLAGFSADLAVVAFSPVERMDAPIEITSRSVHLLVVPDDSNLPEPTLIERQLVAARITFRVLTLSRLRTLIARLRSDASPLAHEKFVKALRGGWADVLDGSPHAPLADELSISFDPSLSPEQLRATLTALANYYRVCGGAGLAAEFESQEAVTEEVHA